MKDYNKVDRYCANAYPVYNPESWEVEHEIDIDGAWIDYDDYKGLLDAYKHQHSFDTCEKAAAFIIETAVALSVK